MKTSQRPNPSSVALGAAAVALPWLFWGLKYLGQDLWWDEITSLIYYSLQPFKETVNHLESTNNHIFFNLVINAFTRVIGERDFYALIDRLPLLRGLQLAFAAVTVLFTYRIGSKFLAPGTGLLAAIVLVTTVPFLNFMEQLRGYSLSMMFVVLVLYHLGCYEDTERKRHLLWVVLGVFCLVYTVLSNAYFVLGLGAIYALQWLRVPGLRRVSLRILITLAIAGCLLALAYAPVWDDFRQVYARTLGAAPPYRTFVLRERLPDVLYGFMSFRYALPILFLAGSFFLVRGFRRPEAADRSGARSELYRFTQLNVLLLLPFGVSFLRNELPFDRTFIHLVPILALVVGVAIQALVRSLTFLRPRPLVAPIALYIYCIATLVYAHHNIQGRLLEDLTTGTRDQDILYNYYLSDHFTPDADTRRYAALLAQARRPVIGVDDVDRFTTSFHFNRFDVPYFVTVSIDEVRAGAGGQTRYLGTYWRTNGKQSWPPLTHTELEFELPADAEGKEFRTLYALLRQKGVLRDRNPDCYVVTAFPDRFVSIVGRAHPQLRLERLSDRVSYLNLFAVYDQEPR
jgi:hypothetical protein